MLWTYQITAASRPRVLMRLVQVFDQQCLVIRSLTLSLLDDHVSIAVTIEVEPGQAHRVRAKLCNQIDIQNVEMYL